MPSIGSDQYITINGRSEGLYKDRGSKFIAIALPADTVDKAMDHLDRLKKEYHDARHHCYAYKIGPGEENYRLNDDGEPSGTAGKPIFGQILSYGLSDILIIVIRYFGGTLLGTGGLIQAYKASAQSAIMSAKITERKVCKSLTLKFTYDYMSLAMRIVKQEILEILKQELTESCRININVRSSKYKQEKEIFENTYGIELT